MGTIAAGSIPYDISLSEITQPAFFHSSHWMSYKLSDGHVFVELTGIVILPEGGIAGGGLSVLGEAYVGSQVRRRTLKVTLDGRKAAKLLELPVPPAGHLWLARPEMWSVSATPASMARGTTWTGTSGAWAVDACDTQWDLGDRRNDGNLLVPLDLYIDVAVAGWNARIGGIAYDFRAIGRLEAVRSQRTEVCYGAR